VRESYLVLHDFDQRRAHRCRNHKLLAQANATAILSELVEGKTSAISFRVQTEFGVLTFRLPARIAEVHQILLKSKAIPPRLRTREQAERVGWRIVLAWLEAQLAMIQAGLVGLEEVLLPFARDSTGETLYERMREAKFSGLLLEEGRSQIPEDEWLLAFRKT
jgi:hypothetical protein